jgi:hypothetical protein
MVVLYQVVERQAEYVFVKMPRLFRIPRTVSVVVQLQYFGGWRQGRGVWHGV